MNLEPGQELGEGILRGDPHGGARRVQSRSAPRRHNFFSAVSGILCRFPEPGEIYSSRDLAGPAEQGPHKVSAGALGPHEEEREGHEANGRKPLLDAYECFDLVQLKLKS